MITLLIARGRGEAFDQTALALPQMRKGSQVDLTAQVTILSTSIVRRLGTAEVVLKEKKWMSVLFAGERGVGCVSVCLSVSRVFRRISDGSRSLNEHASESLWIS
ncbi:hypothetical protein CSUI_007667 [Cystoisospora suis]|uniref:Uncharacterized protein n=1 Tax=Cystoisospora suis TaxID=483139 RepID=A0A2C6KQ41_9APIC|nr:hypothetical protein CSUI_007667 [Cystoisospora suis]